MTDTTAPRTAAGRAFHVNEHGAACSFAAKGSCALVNDGPWGKALIRGIEDEAAEQAIDGAALTLGLTIDGAKMSKNYIDAALARVKETYEREAIEPLLALVRAAQEAFVAAEFPHGTDMSTWSKDEVERFWIDADTRWMEARRTFLTLYVALPESVRVAARKPE